MSETGVRSLFRGWAPTLLRDVPFSALYWCVYETFKGRLLARRPVGQVDRHAESLLSGPEAFASGCGAGLIAAVATMPFDIVKTHRQVELGKLTSEELRTAERGTLRIMSNIYRKRGFSALFTGIVPRIAKVAPACGIMISTYELGKHYYAHLARTRERERFESDARIAAASTASGRST